ncbi:MAG: hypothetical protein ABI384_11580 [Allobranchiibius sp.]
MDVQVEGAAGNGLEAIKVDGGAAWTHPADEEFRIGVGVLDQGRCCIELAPVADALLTAARWKVVLGLPRSFQGAKGANGADCGPADGRSWVEGADWLLLSARPAGIQWV